MTSVNVSSGYDPKSCNALQKPYYRPIEAALRWCGLIGIEAKVLEKVGIELMPGVSDFPQFPCLRANCEKIIDATLNGDLPHGRDGKTVDPDDHVAKHRMTIRHTDLKKWMEENYPDQKPAFLFDEIERATHKKINAESFKALQVENEAQKVRLKNAEAEWLKQAQKLKEAEAEIERLNRTEDIGKPSAMLAVAALMELAAKDRPNYNQSRIISELASKGIKGLSESNLNQMMSKANKMLEDAKRR